MSKHALRAQPADPNPTAPHPSGNAFDATITNLPGSHTEDTVASSCGMYRRLLPDDPWHYEPKPK